MKIVEARIKPLIKFLQLLNIVDWDIVLTKTRDGNHFEDGEWIEYDLTLDPKYKDHFKIAELFDQETEDELYERFETSDIFELGLSVVLSEQDLSFGVLLFGDYHDISEEIFYDYLETIRLSEQQA